MATDCKDNKSCPESVCPIIFAFIKKWDESPSRIECGYNIQQLVNSSRNKEIEQRRALMCMDWMLRVFTPAWFRFAKMDDQADQLAFLPEINDITQILKILPLLKSTKNAVDAAAEKAWFQRNDLVEDPNAIWKVKRATDAARAALWAATDSVAWFAAAEFNETDWIKIMSESVGFGAGWVEDRALAGLLAETTCSEMQQSLLDLVNRMISL